MPERQNQYQNELVQRTLKGQQLASQNFANVEEKLQGMKRDKSLNDLEAQKAVLGWMQNNNTGAGWEAVRPIISKYVSPEGMKTLDTQNAKMRKNQEEDRLEARTQSAFGAYLKGRGLDASKMKQGEYNSEYQAWWLGPGSRVGIGKETDKN